MHQRGLVDEHRGHALLPQPLRQRHAFVVQRIVAGDDDVRRRQSAQRPAQRQRALISLRGATRHFGKDWGILRAGINLNDLGLTDPTRGDAVIWVDAVSGTAVRQGLPARLERV